jgi:hypothetical protein
MTDDEFEEKKRFILKMQAQFAAGMKRLEENLARLESSNLGQSAPTGTRKERKRLLDLLRRLENFES